AARPGRGAGDAAVLFTHRGANLVLGLFVHLRSLLIIKTGTSPKGRSSPEPHDHADGGRWAERGEFGGSLQRSGCALASDAFEPKGPAELPRPRREQVDAAQPPCSRSPYPVFSELPPQPHSSMRGRNRHGPKETGLTVNLEPRSPDERLALVEHDVAAGEVVGDARVREP